MLVNYDNCKCMEMLLLINKVKPYTRNYDLSNYAREVEEGTLCFVSKKIEDNGYYDDINWIQNIEIKYELYPINNCPICGRQIKYKELTLGLTKKH